MRANKRFDAGDVEVADGDHAMRSGVPVRVELLQSVVGTIDDVGFSIGDARIPRVLEKDWQLDVEHRAPAPSPCATPG